MLRMRSIKLSIKASLHKITPQTPPQSKFCKNCKHFKTDFLTGAQFGKCKLYGKQDLVDGNIVHDYASVARIFSCHGVHFEQRPSQFDQFNELFKRYNHEKHDLVETKQNDD
jgi:hypothetical protein